MDSINVLEKELDYLDIMTDDFYTESDDSDEGVISRIKSTFNSLSNHIDDGMIYTQNYIDSQNKKKDSSDYEDRLKNLISQANRAIDNNSEAIAVYDNRSIYNKFNQSVSNIFTNVENFIAERDFKSVDDVISKRDSILEIIDNFDKSLDKDVDVKVWINPATVKNVCQNALSEGMTFNIGLKHIYMNVTRFNNKISSIVRDDSLDKDIKSELVSSSIRLSKKTTSYCISWNRYIMTHYPMTKA